jgi:hypothetical protein
MKKTALAAVLLLSIISAADALAARRGFDGTIPSLRVGVKKFVAWVQSRISPPLPAPAPDPGQP